jgi:sugar phosphate isomerase/epimerase
VPLKNLSVQLYSVRNALEENTPDAIKRIADIGFQNVEASFRFLSQGPALEDAIRANKLNSPTMTSPLFEVDRAPVWEQAKSLGAHSVIDTIIREPHWATIEAVTHVANELNAAAEEAAKHGLHVGYHNHWWELEQKLDGQTAFEALIERLAPEVRLEVDAYWVAVGGEDPLEFVKRHADRIHFLHLKDGPINRENTQQLPAGQGSMPLLEIIEAATNLEVGVIEFDEYSGDVFDAVAQSFAYLNPRVSA